MSVRYHHMLSEFFSSRCLFFFIYCLSFWYVVRILFIFCLAFCCQFFLVTCCLLEFFYIKLCKRLAYNSCRVFSWEWSCVCVFIMCKVQSLVCVCVMIICVGAQILTTVTIYTDCCCWHSHTHILSQTLAHSHTHTNASTSMLGVYTHTHTHTYTLSHTLRTHTHTLCHTHSLVIQHSFSHTLVICPMYRVTCLDWGYHQALHEAGAFVVLLSLVWTKCSRCLDSFFTLSFFVTVLTQKLKCLWPALNWWFALIT